MPKNFDNWNKKKQKIHSLNESKLYHSREIWWCSLGVNIDDKEASVIISQPKLIDTKRLVEKVMFLDKKIFENIRKIVKDLL